MQEAEQLKQAKVIHINRKKAVRNMGLLYFLGCVSLSATGGLTGQLFDSIGFYNLNQKIVLIMFISYTISSFFVKQILSVFKNHKYSIMVGFAINGLQIAGTLVTYVCYLNKESTGVCDYTFLKAINLLAGLLVGAIASVLLWTGFYSFIDFISLPDEKPIQFASFFIFLQFNGIVAHSLNFVFYSFKLNTLYCFLFFFGIYAITVVSIPLVLPNTESYDPELDP